MCCVVHTFVKVIYKCRNDRCKNQEFNDENGKNHMFVCILYLHEFDVICNELVNWQRYVIVYKTC